MFRPLYDFICNFDFQYIPKVAIMLPFVGVMNIMKLINIISIKECMDIKSGLMVLNTPRHVVPFI
jgi:hypothetical protein